MEILKLNQKNFKKIIIEAKNLIKRGRVIICPTDTVYGLIADATNKKAIERVFRIKKRERKKPIPVFVKDIEMAKKFAHINKNQERFLNSVWPGKITVVFKRKKSKLPNILFGEEKTIGLRIPKYKLINKLSAKLNFPLTGTSANISGKPASTKIKEIINQFKTRKIKSDLILDDGNLPPSLPSTVIDLTSKKIKILRKGEIKFYGNKNN